MIWCAAAWRRLDSVFAGQGVWFTGFLTLATVASLGL